VIIEIGVNFDPDFLLDNESIDFVSIKAKGKIIPDWILDKNRSVDILPLSHKQFIKM
jgi:hypothetical protein